MNNTQAYQRGAVIFREGDPGDCMYELETGSVGVYRDYGGPDEKLIATLMNSKHDIKVFGEMGLLENAPRSATVVVLENNTILTRISEADFRAYFAENPAKVLDIMQQMCNRLRKTTKDYVEACHTVYDAVETEKTGKTKSKSLLDRLDELCAFYVSYVPHYPYF